MRIHTVKEGDTIFKIARSYSVPPAKIIENNALTTPDRLYPGQKLLILTPTRTHTVRGGDTLSSIALRFGTDTGELKRNNPSLMGGDRIYPGQIIAVKYGEKEYGNAVVNGYFSKDTEKERLALYLPYLTYLTLASHKYESGKLWRLFNYEDALRVGKEEARVIMRVYIKDGLEELSKNEERLFENIISEAKTQDFDGVSFCGACVKEDGFCRFLKKAKKLLKEFELHVELDGNDTVTPYKDISELADVSLLNYERERKEYLNDFNDCEGALLSRYAEECEARKTLFDIFSPSYLGDAVTDFSEIERLMILRGIECNFSESSKNASFKIKHYSGGKESEILALFPTPENTKAKLTLLGELGYMGVSFDIKRCPISSLMAFNALFRCERATGGAIKEGCNRL